MQISLSICNWLWSCFYAYFICYHVSPFMFVPLDYKLNVNKDCVSYFLCNLLHASYIALHCQCFINSTNWSSNFYSNTGTRWETTHKICMYDISARTVSQWHPRGSSIVGDELAHRVHLGNQILCILGAQDGQTAPPISLTPELKCSLGNHIWAIAIKIGLTKYLVANTFKWIKTGLHMSDLGSSW